LLSPGFLASRFIVSEEIPPFTGDGPMKGVFPVGLKPIPLDGTARLHGIDKFQIFRLNGKFYTERGVDRDSFASQLAVRIRNRTVTKDSWRNL
jgi:hypothetical protein